MLENKKETLSLVSSSLSSNEESIRKLKKNYNKELDYAINDLYSFIQTDKLTETSLREIKEEIDGFIGYKISDSLSIKINNLLISKYEDYIICIHQDKSIIIKNEEDLISFLNIVNVTIETVEKENNITVSLNLITYEQELKYHYKIKFVNLFNGISRISIDVCLQLAINNLVKKLILSTYFELKKITNYKPRI